MSFRYWSVSLIAFPALATAAEPVLPARQLTALTDCVAKVDSAERLACYDRAVESLRIAAASQDVVIVERAEVRKARKGLFGFALPRVGFLAGRSGNAEDEADAQRLVTTITSARPFGYGNWRFTTETGAIWETTEVRRGFDEPRPGRTVEIAKGSLSSYFAKVGTGIRVQVRRVQ